MKSLKCFIASVCIAFTGTVWANEGHVVFGSWLNADQAALAAEDVSRDLDIRTHIVPIVVDGQRFHRLISEFLPEVEAAELMRRADESGRSTWFVVGESLVQASASPETPRIVPVQPPISVQSKEIAVQTAVQTEVQPEIGADSAPETPIVETESTLTFSASDSGAPVEVPYFGSVEIVVDGLVDEPIWSSVPAHDNMRVIDPDTLEKATFATHTRFLYTSKGLYVAASMEQPPETLVSRLSSRDKFLNRDSFGITLDTSGEGIYGYWFTVALGGSYLDGKVIPERTFSELWDGPWVGNSAETDDGWSVEMFLPWSMMAMPKRGDDRKMGLWIDRKVAHMDERYGWPALPLAGARFMSALQPMVLPGGLAPKQQTAVFPYVSNTYDAIDESNRVRIGADLSWRPSSNLQLTATLNPDFGAVESDDVVVNLTAFETFFPEKRLFFLEGNEVFVTSPRSDVKRFQTTAEGTGARKTPPTFNPEPTTLLNTRRIGGPPRHVTIPDGIFVPAVERGKPTDLIGAVKTVGQFGGVRYGLLAAAEDEVVLPGVNIETGEEVAVVEDGRNFGVARLSYEVAGEGRKALGWMGTITTLPEDDAFSQGVDAHWLSRNGKWRSDSQLMHSNVDTVNGYGGLTDLVYTPITGHIHRLSFEYFDENLDISNLGFLRQNDAIGMQYGYTRQTGQGLKRFKNSRTAFFVSAQTNTDGLLNRAGIFTNQTLLLHNSSQVRFEVDYYPERWDDINSRGNGIFKTDARWFTQIAYGTDSAKKFAWSAAIGAEQEELNYSWTYSSDLGLTWRPVDRFSFDLDLRIKKRDGWLLYTGGRDFTTYDADDFQPRFAVDYFISARQQLRLTMQWAGVKARAQDYWIVPPDDGDLLPRPPPGPGEDPEDFTLSRLTAQFRYRWEIGPLSDLFVVYTRGSAIIDDDLTADFGDLYRDAVENPIIDLFVVKLRYRFGT